MEDGQLLSLIQQTVGGAVEAGDGDQQKGSSPYTPPDAGQVSSLIHETAGGAVETGHVLQAALQASVGDAVETADDDQQKAASPNTPSDTGQVIHQTVGGALETRDAHKAVGDAGEADLQKDASPSTPPDTGQESSLFHQTVKGEEETADGGQQKLATTSILTLTDTGQVSFMIHQIGGDAVEDVHGSQHDAATTSTQSDTGQSDNVSLEHLDEGTHEVDGKTKEDFERMLVQSQEALEDMKKTLSKTERQLEKANEYNETLRNMVETLSSELHQFKTRRTSHVAVQVNVDDLLNIKLGGSTLLKWSKSLTDTIPTAVATRIDAAVTCQANTQSVQAGAWADSVSPTGLIQDPVKALEDLEIAWRDSVSLDKTIQGPAKVIEDIQADQNLTAADGDHQTGLSYNPAAGFGYEQPVECVGEEDGLSIADAVRATAEAVVTQQTVETLAAAGYMYDSHSGLYYHPQSGYYYDQNKGLFYEPHSGTYYYYDYDSGEYIFHSQVNFETTTNQVQPQATTDNQKQTGNKTIENKLLSGKKKKKTPKKVYTNRKERRRAMKEILEQRKKQRSKDKKNNKRRDRSISSPSRKGTKKDKQSDSSISKSDRKGTNKHKRSDRSNSTSQRKKEQKHKPSSRHSSDRSVPTRQEVVERKQSYNNSKRKRMDTSSEQEFNGQSGKESKASSALHRNNERCVREFTQYLKKKGSRKDSLISSIVDLCSDVSDDNDDIVTQVHEQLQNEFSNSISRSKCSSKHKVHNNTLSKHSKGAVEISELGNSGKRKHDLKSKRGFSTYNNGSSSEMLDKRKISVGVSEDRHIEEKLVKRASVQDEFVNRLKKLGTRTRDRCLSRGERKRLDGRVTDREDRSHVDSGTESGELSDTGSASSASSTSSSASFKTSSSSSSWTDSSCSLGALDLTVSAEPDTDEEESMETDYTSSWPPCIRMIVCQSDEVDVGMLYIVTYSGATIGRLNTGICIPDSNVSKLHAVIEFNNTTRQYEIWDGGSQNGTFINSNRVSKDPGKKRELHHGNVLHMGSTKILCHIHQGSDTCDECEPGIVIANHQASLPAREIKFVSKEDKQKQAKEQLKQMKKKYGLQISSAANNPPNKNANYTDRADERRRTVGSDVPHVRQDATASVHRPLSTANVGHKLLQKMGWKEGESLGKNNSGIQEPISVGMRANQKSGLGSGTTFSLDETGTMDIRKASRRIQAQHRFDKLSEGGSLVGSASTTSSSSSSSSASVAIDSSSTVEPSPQSSQAKKYSFKQWTKGGVEFSGT